ncbi:MAG: polysaccharide pyruvyl transferase family protein [Dysgonamonadaceae bacterium]|nr:polysaccharide pyruvyl transferase family protein [Dysgonamonadaceae bacterium]
MKKVAIITFHSSHNYGSVLQAYALQNFILKLGYKCEIINFRTERQIDLYTVFTKRKGIKYLFKNASHLLYYKSLSKRYIKFEEFINNHLKLTDKTYRELSELEDANFDYDYYISGSDQIWNPVPADFDWAFYLAFVKKGKRISYAPSFGQLGSTGDGETKSLIRHYLSNYDSVSVRDYIAQGIVKEFINILPPITLDPTLLLKKEEWNGLVDQDYSANKEYIFFYTLSANKEIIKVAEILSKKLKLPIITSNFSNQYDVFSSYIKKFDTGPKDFLSLIKNAKLVLASSYHGTIFSILFNKPFYSFKGNQDARISYLLEITGLKSRSIDLSNIHEESNNAFNIDYNSANIRIEKEREKSLLFLKKALEIEDKNEDM